MKTSRIFLSLTLAVVLTSGATAFAMKNGMGKGRMNQNQPGMEDRSGSDEMTHSGAGRGMGGEGRGMKNSDRGGKKGNRSEDGSGMTLSGKTLTSTELSCAANAVTKRENALSNAVGTMNGTQMTALSTRAMALGNAWTISDGSARKAAINTAWNNWKTSMETAQKTLNTTRVTILSSFKSDMQTCKVDDSEMPMMESENVPMNR